MFSKYLIIVFTHVENIYRMSATGSVKDTVVDTGANTELDLVEFITYTGERVK